jgi:eukaryotic-like serine/threonine-protein kinase
MTEQSPAEIIFFAALEKATPGERVAYLDAACGDDHNLRRRVERLLAAHPQIGNFLEPPARGENVGPAEAPTIPPREDGPADPARAETVSYDSPVEGVGAVIAGKYKLLETLGQGGMGAVFMAQQTQPVKRLVALKLIKLGMDTKQVLARFEAERQALALMDHPNIAKVLDAGTTDSGRPFFVMELVKGVPITRFCDERQLSPRQRLELFIPVCQAIQHAHQKGIIHRDIKPTNVLVALYDDRPVPKVIDFGVAKATGQQLTDASLMTGFGGIVGTPEYMSPEQAQLNQLDIDTRSDVYALGVLLYELLTGTTPIDRKRLGQGALFEILRIVREEDPPRPSARLSTSDALASIAATRKTEPARLAKLMRGELDWIVMKCLEKDRARRYETANGLAHDLERYLADEPVEACPPSSTYRLRKLAGKYKKALATAAAFVVLLAAGAAISTLLAVWATSAEHEANRLRIASDEAKQEALNAERKALDAKAEADKQRDEARVTAYASGMQLAQRAWEENNVVRARELLEEVPKEAAGRRLRGFEWYYLSRLCHSEKLTLKGHSGAVMSVSLSPDGQRLASGSLDGTVKIWDSATGKELLTFKETVGGVWSVAFSPDGRRVASAGWDNMMRIWDSATRQELFALEGHAFAVTSVAFSPNGLHLASGSGDDAVKIWDIATGKEIFSLKGHAGQINGVAFSPDGRRVASGSADKTVKIWDIATRKELFSLSHAGMVLCVAFSPNGHYLASGSGDDMVKIWDSVTGKELLAHNGHASQSNSAGFGPAGRHLASGSWGEVMRTWGPTFDKELLALKGHAPRIDGVAFSPTGLRLASGNGDSSVTIWDTATGQLFDLKGHADAVTSVAFSPDGQRLASASDDTTVKIWDCATSGELFDLKGHAKAVTSVAFSPDGRRLASASYDNTLKLWDSGTGQELFALKGGVGPVASVAYSPDGHRVASGSWDNTVKIWDGATGKELLSLNGHARAVNSVAFSPDGKRLASGSEDETVKLWESSTGKELFSANGHARGVTGVAFSPDGQRVASGSRDNTVKIWDSTSGKELSSLRGHADQVLSVAFSPDGERLASGGNDRSVKIWESSTGKELFDLKGHAASVASVVFSPDGHRLASASHDNTVRIWDSVAGRELFCFKDAAGRVEGVAFSPDGQGLASANSNGSIHLWETNVSSEIQRRRGITQMVAGLFGQLFLRVDVLERLRALPGMSPSHRQDAITVAQTYPEDPSALNERAWPLVTLPGGEMSGYRKALRYSEEACRLEPKNGLSLNTLGVAYYRVGDYEKALATLLRSNEINTVQLKGSLPADLSFLAMTQQQLGHAKEAQAALQRLRERMKDPRWAKDNEEQGFLREAEALLAKPKSPAGK